MRPEALKAIAIKKLHALSLRCGVKTDVNDNTLPRLTNLPDCVLDLLNLLLALPSMPPLCMDRIGRGR